MSVTPSAATVPVGPIARIVAPSLEVAKFYFDEVAKWAQVDAQRQLDDLPDSHEHLLAGLRICMSIMDSCRTACGACEKAKLVAQHFQSTMLAQVPALREVNIDTKALEAQAEAMTQQEAALDGQWEGCNQSIGNAANLFDALTRRFHSVGPTRVGFSEAVLRPN